MSNSIMWLLWLTFIHISIFGALKCPQCRNETVIRSNERLSVHSNTTFTFTTHNEGDISYDLWFVYDGQIDLNLDIETASMTLVDSSLPHQGVTLIGKQYNSSIKTKINLLCPSNTNAYKLHSKHEIDIFTPLACPIECISYNDATKEYQQCNGRGICSFDPFILQTHCLCETGYNSSSQCAESSTLSRRRLTILPRECRQIILDQHNTFRETVASGRLQYEYYGRFAGLPPPVPQTLPEAATGAMTKLEWDYALEDQASVWADKLKAHSAGTAFSIKWHSRPNIGKLRWGLYTPRIGVYGENLFMTPISAGSINDACVATKKWWEDELQWYLWGTYTDSKRTAGGMDIGHLTQAMWGDTQKIGCGYSQFGGFNYIVCQYTPQGNWLGPEGIPYVTSSSSMGSAAGGTESFGGGPHALEKLKAKEKLKARAEKSSAKAKTKARAGETGPHPSVSATAKAKAKAKEKKKQMDIRNFIYFLREPPTAHAFLGATMSESQFVKYCKDNGYSTTFTEAQLKRLFRGVLSKNRSKKMKESKKFKAGSVYIKSEWAYFGKVSEAYVQKIFVEKKAAVQAYDNYYNDNYYNDNSFYEDGRVDKSLSDNIYHLNPYFYAQFVAFNFIQITLQTLILSLLFCACGGSILFFISKWSKKSKSNHYIYHDAVDQV